MKEEEARVNRNTPMARIRKSELQIFGRAEKKREKQVSSLSLSLLVDLCGRRREVPG